MTFKTTTTTTPAPDENGETPLYFKAIKKELDSLSPADKKNRCNSYIDGILSGYYPDVKPSKDNVLERLKLFYVGLEPETRTPPQIPVGADGYGIAVTTNGYKKCTSKIHIAKYLGVSRNTLYKYLDNPSFKQDIKRYPGDKKTFYIARTVKKKWKSLFK